MSPYLSVRSSKRENRSDRNVTNSCGVIWDEMAVKPTISAIKFSGREEKKDPGRTGKQQTDVRAGVGNDLADRKSGESMDWQQPQNNGGAAQFLGAVFSKKRREEGDLGLEKMFLGPILSLFSLHPV